MNENREPATCPHCDGSGYEKARLLRNGMLSCILPCRHCDGTGETYAGITPGIPVNSVVIGNMEFKWISRESEQCDPSCMRCGSTDLGYVAMSKVLVKTRKCLACGEEWQVD